MQLLRAQDVGVPPTAKIFKQSPGAALVGHLILTGPVQLLVAHLLHTINRSQPTMPAYPTTT